MIKIYVKDCIIKWLFGIAKLLLKRTSKLLNSFELGTDSLESGIQQLVHVPLGAYAEGTNK